MTEHDRKKALLPVLLVYGLLFYGLWSLWEFRGTDIVSRAVKNEYLAQMIKSGLIKNLVWTLPALCLLRRFNDEAYVGGEEMFTRRVNIRKTIPIFLGFTAYLLLGALIVRGRLAISADFQPSDLIIVLFVGLTEETVFRGWLLNVSVREERKWLPVLVNALLFLLIHFPRWIAERQFFDVVFSINVLAIPLLSVIFSWSFLKSKSLWLPIALHTYWDLLTFLFY